MMSSNMKLVPSRDSAMGIYDQDNTEMFETMVGIIRKSKVNKVRLSDVINRVSNRFAGGISFLLGDEERRLC